jgi:branched-chain amino acid transport system ATP-binding protein
VLEIHELHVGYGRVSVVRGVSLTVGKGEIVSLLGSNGAGKTTLLYALSGLNQPTAGRATFDGIRINNLPSHQIVNLGLVHVPEGRKVFPSLTVLENLEMGSIQKEAKRNRTANMKRVFDLFPRLLERKDQLTGTLSGGEQQMLAIGRGLMAQPKLLILDEPSLGLSPKVVISVFECVKAINLQGIPVLLVEQNVVHSLKISHRGYIMENGRIMLSGTGRDLLKDPHTKACYLASSS